MKNLSGVKAIATNSFTSLAVKNDGTVWIWAWSKEDGSRCSIPCQVEGLTDVVDVAAGSLNLYALRSDGTVWSWEDIGKTKTPVQVKGLTDVRAISAGSLHALALKRDGTVWAWGKNINGELGDGTKEDRDTPVQVANLTDVVAIAAGRYNSLALKADGSVWAWGKIKTEREERFPVKISGLTDVTMIASDGAGFLALTRNGEVWKWIFNDAGYDGVFFNADQELVKIPGPGGEGVLKNVKYVAANGLVFMAIAEIPKEDYVKRKENERDLNNSINGNKYKRQAGSIVAWGSNSKGQLGNGEKNTDSKVMVQINDLNDVVEVAAGEGHSLALKSDGTVWAWGNNHHGELGDGTGKEKLVPMEVPGLTDVVSIAAGRWHSLALRSDGTVWAWGYGGFGQLGDGKTHPYWSQYTPVMVSGLTDVIKVAAGADHSLALKSDGTVWAWGYNFYGQLGDGTNQNREVPVQVKGLADVVAIAAGKHFSLALKSDGTVWIWGMHEDYWGGLWKLGENSWVSANEHDCPKAYQVIKKDNYLLPTKVNDLNNVVAIAAGSTHVLALLSDGTIRAWGENSQGEVGDGTFKRQSTPVPVKKPTGEGMLSDVISIFAGGGDYSPVSFAVLKDGSIWTWGSDYQDQNFSFTRRNNLPTVIGKKSIESKLNHIISLSVGDGHVLAIVQR
ncbi:RCC1 domain-containing protein [Hydrogenibacillus schlegelii]|uniref:RCC1 domain-containing protein n=1 Tax=Hydrogenibacillus schlegelii TaxID=1484 RepID=UPI0023520913|nr:hypothetical protein [Hydrogenibacillus schlegelii]